MRVKRIIAALLSLFLLILPLGGCADPAVRYQTPVTQAIDAYYQTLSDWDFASCYLQLDEPSQQAIPLQTFVTRYQSLWNALELESFTADYTQPAKVGETYVSTVTMRYDTKAFGPLEFTYPLTLSEEDGTWQPNWDFAMLLEGMTANHRARVDTLTAKRGEIFSADRTPWAINTYAPTAYVRLSKLNNEEAFAITAAPALGMTPEAILAALRSERSVADGLAILRSYPVDDVGYAFETSLAQMNIQIDRAKYTPVRYYPQGSLMSHLIGYTQPIDAETLADKKADGYTEASIIGRTGLEASYESTLRGTNGKRLVLVNEDGVITKEIARISAVDGLDLELSIDYHLQKTAQILLEQLSADQAGAVVVMDPSTGEILVSESAPTFDVNLFSAPIAKEVWDELNTPAAPLYNRVTQALYPPGSTVKPITALAAMQSGKFSSSYVFPSNIGSIINRTWLPTYESWPYPGIVRASNYDGAMNMTNAIIHSDNIYFAHLALQLGWDTLISTLKSFGFGEKMTYDVGIASSAIYTRQTLENRKLLADTGYGQGEMLTTPLQMAVVLSGLANKGTIMQPHVVTALRQMSGQTYETVGSITPEVWLRADLSTGAYAAVEDMMHQVMTTGTGRSANVSGMTVYGKTGTAQVDDTGTKEIAWMFAYVREPGYSRLVCVALETPPKQGALRYQLVKELLSRTDNTTPLPTLPPTATQAPDAIG